MSDMSDASGQMPRRTPRVNDGGAPVGGAVAIVLAVVAVVAGFLILNSISDGGEAALDFPADGQTGDGSGAESSDPSQTSSTIESSTTTTVPAIITDGASVIVANANSQGGSAGAMKRALETGPGFTVVAAVDAAATVPDLADSVIYYRESNPQALPVANSLGEVLGGVSSIAPLVEPAPTIDGDMQGADVLLMLGDDKANKTLEELNPQLNATGGATLVTSPPIATETTTTTTTG